MAGEAPIPAPDAEMGAFSQALQAQGNIDPQLAAVAARPVEAAPPVDPAASTETASQPASTNAEVIKSVEKDSEIGLTARAMGGLVVKEVAKDLAKGEDSRIRSTFKAVAEWRKGRQGERDVDSRLKAAEKGFASRFAEAFESGAVKSPEDVETAHGDQLKDLKDIYGQVKYLVELKSQGKHLTAEQKAELEQQEWGKVDALAAKKSDKYAQAIQPGEKSQGGPSAAAERNQPKLSRAEKRAQKADERAKAQRQELEQNADNAPSLTAKEVAEAAEADPRSYKLREAIEVASKRRSLKDGLKTREITDTEAGQLTEYLSKVADKIGDEVLRLEEAGHGKKVREINGRKIGGPYVEIGQDGKPVLLRNEGSSKYSEYKRLQSELDKNFEFYADARGLSQKNREQLKKELDKTIFDRVKQESTLESARDELGLNGSKPNIEVEPAGEAKTAASTEAVAGSEFKSPELLAAEAQFARAEAQLAIMRAQMAEEQLREAQRRTGEA